MTTADPEIRPLGLDALLIRFARTPSAEASAAAQSARVALEAADLTGVRQIATSLASVLLEFDPTATDRDALTRAVSGLVAVKRPAGTDLPPPRRRWTIPVHFGGDDAPELAEAAALAGVSETAAVAEIAAQELRVLAIGFAPGQPYLGLLPENWDLPRQASLTPRVPPGAVIVAVRQLVLFTAPNTTGWRQIGRAGFRPFLPGRARPFALEAGDAVRLAPVARDAIPDAPDGLGGARLEVLA